MMGQIANGAEKGERTYNLKMQIRCNGSDHEWCDKRRKDILAEGAEHIQSLSQIANGMAKAGGTYILKVQSGHDGEIVNGTVKGEGTYLLKMQSGYDGSDHKWQGKRTYLLKMQIRYDGSDCEWHGKRRKDIQPEDAEWV
jgi:hypothetical protein